MRELRNHEVKLISGGDDDEDYSAIDICVVLGAGIGLIGGMYSTLAIIKKYPCILLSSRVLEQVTTAACAGGVVVGGTMGFITGLVIDNT